jgi:hypothetical protein
MTEVPNTTSSSGLYRTASSFDASLSPAQRRKLVRDGLIEPLFRGVYRDRSDELPSFEQRAIGASWSARGVISAGTALRFYDARRFRTYDRIYISIEEQRRVSLSGATIRRRRGLTEADIVQLHSGVFVTSVAVALLDAALDATDFEIRSAYHDLWSRDPLLPSQVEEVLDRLGASGRHGTERLRATYLRYPADGNPAWSENELRLYDGIVDAGLLVPRLNYPVRRADGRLAYIDVAFPELKYGIEVDHTVTHGERVGQWQRDIDRSFELGYEDWFLDRVKEDHVEQYLDRTLEMVRRRLARFRGIAA